MSARSTMEARDFRAALKTANQRLLVELELVNASLDDATGALKADMEHFTEVERENGKLRQLTKELTCLRGTK